MKKLQIFSGKKKKRYKTRSPGTFYFVFIVQDFFKILMILLILSTSKLISAPYLELVPDFDRNKSRVMVRKVVNPTLAKMDYAAYINNPVRFNPETFNPKKPEKKVALKSMLFKGYLEQVCNTLKETPLTSAEKNQPMAWSPLANHLWELTKDVAFSEITSKINGEKWGDPSIFKPYQELITVYLHQNKNLTELWVKIEFAPWVKFLKGISDEDDDGFVEVYGKIPDDKIKPEVLKKAVQWIKSDYLKKKITLTEIDDWVNILASYWYPSLNTDILELTGKKQWPAPDTEKEIKKELRGLVIKNPVAVIKGRPLKQAIYNIYVVEGVTSKAESEKKSSAKETAGTSIDISVSENFQQNYKRFAQEKKSYGSYADWNKKNQAFKNGITRLLKSLPKEQLGIQGRDDWIFFRKSLEYMTGGDLNQQEKDKNPIPHIVEFKKYLESHKVNLLFVSVPSKPEVYFNELPLNSSAKVSPLVHPYGRKFLQDLQAAGVEVIDLLPHFLKAKKEDSKNKENVYQKQDTHWTHRGIQIAADLVSRRIQEYSWFKSLPQGKFSITDTSFSRQGDIVDKLPEAQRKKYPAVQLRAGQVKTSEGKLHKRDKESPILLIGDSFTGVYELIDCKGAGVGSHIAAKSGIPVDIITSWGGGPLVRQKMVRARHKHLSKKKLVIYLMTARDLYNYSQSWAPLVVKE